ncbi:RluA family pseudouridine synthase [Tatumella punctata]|uniref:RluA family pseudouridine synthase n=1 Tax=Tatumella punctata TaxID=399969 RepID=A0ABW1VPZ3_9GAMM
MSAIVDTFIAPPCTDSIEILYQDEHLLLINKPAGLLSLSGKNPQNLDSVHYRLVKEFPGCTLVHRLDFGTSGVMVVARNKAINAALSQQFSQRLVTKQYEALLCGYLKQSEGIIDAPIAKDPALFPRMSVCAVKGKVSRSVYRLLGYETYPLADGTLLPVSRVRLLPETGRTHQLRIHCQHLGFPIAGCDLYGGREQPGSDRLPRLMLHASQLHFTHPVTGRVVDAGSHCPF